MTISVNSAAGAKGNEANFITDSSGNVTGLIASDHSGVSPFLILPTGSGYAATNASSIHASLDAYGSATVFGQGDIYIDDTLWLDDGNALVTAPGARLRLASGSDALMVGTKPMKESASSVTVSWTNGITASVAWTAHGRSVGDAICLQGANETLWNSVFRVIAITDANNLVIATHEFASAAPTGTITAKRCVRKIKVDVDLYYDYTNNASASQGYNRHACMIGYAADVETLSVRAENVYKYALCTMATLNVRGSVNGIDVGDICKMYGPARSTWLRVSGEGHDDCCSIQAKEPAAYIAYQEAFGPVKDCGYIDTNVVNTGGAASGAIVIYADDDHEIDGITIERGSALSNLNSAIAIKFGSGFTTSKIGGVTIRDIACGGLATYYAINVSAGVKNLNIERPRMLPSTSAASNAVQIVRIESTATVGLLRMAGFTFDHSDWPSTGAAAYMINLNGAINRAEFVDAYIRGRAATARLINVGTNGVGAIALRNCDLANLSQIGIVNDGASGTVRITMDGVRADTVTTGWDVRDDATVTMRNSTFASMSNGVVRPTTNARTVHVYDQGGNSYSSASPITCASPGVAVPHGIELPIDIGATGITKAAGASCFNNGSGRGTIAQNIPVVCDGANWFQMTDLTKTY